jgi:ubiquinone/menaquinone biosynthesis C-methylase UbiE
MDDQLLQKRNRFGLLAQDYAKHRRGYPTEVYEEIRKRLPNRSIDALDVGCGTAVVTYELAKFCHSVIGTDKETEMITVAQSNAPDNCIFQVAPAEALPFPDTSFDLITVAQAFHWFDHDKVISEFRRLIRPGGLIIVFRKQGKEGNKILADFVWPVVNRYIELPHLPRVQNDFSKLKDAGFVSCEIVNVPYEELYTPDEYIGFLRSHSSYNLIPEDKREAYLQAIRVEMTKHLENGFVAIRGIVEMWLLRA